MTEAWGVTGFFSRDPFGRLVNILSHPDPASELNLKVLRSDMARRSMQTDHAGERPAVQSKLRPNVRPTLVGDLTYTKGDSPC